MLAPLMHPTNMATFFLICSGKGCFARISEIATRPPGLRIRKISWKTAGFSASGTRLITQFEQTMSAIPSGSAIDVMLDFTFVPPLVKHPENNTMTHKFHIGVAAFDSILPG